MYTIYKTILDLCNKRGVSPTKMSKEAGISRSIMTELKAGRTKNPSTDTLSKIANYFGVSVDDLVSADSYRHGPPTQQTPTITDDDLMFALFGDVKDELTKEDLDDVRAYAEFVMKRKLDAQQNKED